MIKTIELNGVKYQVDTEADIPPGKWYIDDDYPITPPEQCSFPITDPCCQLILSCSDPSEAARLGVPVSEKPVNEITLNKVSMPSHLLIRIAICLKKHEPEIYEMFREAFKNCYASNAVEELYKKQRSDV